MMSNADEDRSRWAEYFGQLYMAENTSRRQSLAGGEKTTTDPPVAATPPSLDEVRKTVSMMKGGKAPSVSNVRALML